MKDWVLQKSQHTLRRRRSYKAPSSSLRQAVHMTHQRNDDSRTEPSFLSGISLDLLGAETASIPSLRRRDHEQYRLRKAGRMSWHHAHSYRDPLVHLLHLQRQTRPSRSGSFKTCDTASGESDSFVSREAHTTSFLNWPCRRSVLFQEHEYTDWFVDAVTTGHAGGI